MNEPNGEQPNRPSGIVHFLVTMMAVAAGVPVGLIVSFVLIGGFLMLSILMLAVLAGGSASTTGPVPREYQYKYGTAESANRLVSVPIVGPIVSQSSASDPLSTIFGIRYTDGEKVKEQLAELAADGAVKGVVLEIDSPGGMITASKAIADGVATVQAANKPIVAHINGYGASGAYWVASAADFVAAEQGSLVGSIGVIFGDVPYFENITSIGGVGTQTPIKIRSFSAGGSKDIGNPFRDMTAAEEAFIRQSLEREYDQFVGYVSAKRKIEPQELKQNIAALPYDTAEGKRLRLIDEVMSKEAAYKLLAERANIGEDFVLETELTYPGFFDGFFGALLRHKPGAEPVQSPEARGRYCQKLAATPLVFHGSLKTICSD